MARELRQRPISHPARTPNDTVALLIGIVVLLAILATASLSLDFCLSRL